MTKANTPRKIRHNGNIITSPSMIADIANQHYITKINNINDTISKKRDPLYLLNKIIPRKDSHNNFTLKYITVRDTIKIIRSMKNSHSTAEDDITNAINKKLYIHIAYQICHMINCVMGTSVFPTIFKTTRIIPVSKPGKPADDIDSFRPINNMGCLEKILEEWIKTLLVDWLNAEDIISMHHHGGRQGFSTLTAKTNIDKNINLNLNDKNYNVALTTDLSAAFDTIEHMTLLRTRPEVSEGGPAITNLIQGIAREEADRHIQIEVSMDLPLTKLAQP